MSMAEAARPGRAAGVVGITLGALAAAGAAGLAIERIAVRRALGHREDAYRDEPFGTLRGAPYPVTADDGVQLHVEIDEPHEGADPAPVTVILSHGYALNLDSWHFQRRDLREIARLVLWDQRSHGRSARSAVGAATIEHTGRDLGRVIDEVAPTGPLLLVGHSMGGMSIMSLAEQRPALFADRVVGVAFLATSAAGLTHVRPGVRGVPGRFVRRLAPGVVAALGKQADLIDRGRQIGSDLGLSLTRRYSFASDVPPSFVQWTSDMLAATPIDVVAEFFPDFDRHDRVAALSALGDVEALIMVGREDKVTPLVHSEAILAALPHAEMVVLELCGHMLLLEHHKLVTEELRELIDRVR